MFPIIFFKFENELLKLRGTRGIVFQTEGSFMKTQFYTTKKESFSTFLKRKVYERI